MESTRRINEVNDGAAHGMPPPGHVMGNLPHGAIPMAFLRTQRMRRDFETSATITKILRNNEKIADLFVLHSRS